MTICVTGSACYELVKTRMRIHSHYIIRGKVLRTKNRQECEAECDRERQCRGFNYRFKTLGYNQYRDNCELSSKDASDREAFDFDEDFDFYEQISDSRRCRDSGNWGNSGGYSGSYSGSYSGGGGSSFGSSNSWGGGGYSNRDECFTLARTETTLENRIVRETFEARDIRDCEDQCTRTRRFVCRAFAFK
ncbi:hypothetical protein SK128_018182 [Halocaridina rubra]|uniref:Apple domain-containing protein n=1 Tax=Halocaridina rubra TaxID=373956 RepID=A0AAN8XCK9_HALRR